MQPFKDNSSEPDQTNTKKSGMERETIEFPTARADAPDASEELAAQGERLLRLQAEMQNLRNRTSRG